MVAGLTGTEWTARADFKHRLWALRAAIERYLILQRVQITSSQARSPGTGYTSDQQKLNSAADSQIDVVLNAANNLRRALRSKHLPPSMRGRSLGHLDEPIRHVRNIREHWDENRAFLFDGSRVPGQNYASARWFKANYPDKTPWSSSWSNLDGPIVCGIIPLNELLVIVGQLEALIPTE